MDLAGALGLSDRELVSFVGAGGKKTAMGELVSEADGAGRSVAYTTTTHMPPPPDLPLALSAPAAIEGWDRVALATERVPDPDRADEKVRGFAPVAVDDLFASGRFDWVLVKADGARRRAFKAPGPDEPALPRASTRVVPVASVRVVGDPLDESHVHRVERVAALTDLSRGDTIDARAVGTVLASREGGCKGVPDGAAVTPLVNKADTPALRETAREVISIALERSDALSRGLLTSFREDYVETVDP